MSKVLAVGNLKGGTGKTTLAVNLACAYARRRRVALVDSDSQGAAAAWTGTGKSPLAARHLPLDAKHGGVTDTEDRRRDWVAEMLSLRTGHDLVVLDLPPQFEDSVAGALALADLLVVPVTPGGAELAATRRARQVLERARAARPSRALDCVLVPNRVDRRTAIGRALTHTLGDLGESVGPALRQRADQMSAYTSGTWVGGHAPDSEAHKEIEALARFLAERLWSPSSS
ncbi:ParA family protein [Ferruginivarius sediminum]|uniref:ParA family protein n=1 Tax=Ferruginivarius sediminum TaxID=2661937 RepID=A0A369TEV7_9PROT|nr:ParA family protein [Ferruginivarius sediminum]RDD63901.1 ParA family protein [Ferruginivarius sediminum]